jgi:hypothetical protein
MKRAIFFVLLVISCHTLSSQNLVVNPGMEIWGKVTKPTGWNISVNCQKDSGNFKSGTYACRHSSTISETKNLGQTIEVIPEKKYRLSFYYKTETIGTEHGCRIWCSWKDATPVDITDASAKLILQPSTYMKSDTWQQFTVDITAPVNARYFYLEVRTYQNTVAYYDDFVFEENVATNNPEEELEKIDVYPNPAYDVLNISNLHNLQHIDIQTISGLTRWYADYHGEESVTIPVSELPSGLYLLRIKTVNELFIRRIIKK